MHSCFYTGEIRHRRFTQPEHAFTYKLFMVYLDLDEVDTVFRRVWGWSTRRLAPAWFRRADYLKDDGTPLKEAVRRLVAEKLGRSVDGPVRLLTHLRYFGVRMNPVSFYFCWDVRGEQLEAVLLEVTNTPWGERQCYVVDCAGVRRPDRFFQKNMHVSPFLDMDMRYQLLCRPPRERLTLHLENWREADKVFDATLALRRRPITQGSSLLMLLAYPWMTLQVLGAIYFEAFRLWWKGARFHAHPGHGTARKETVKS